MGKDNFKKLKEFIALAKSVGCSELKYEADGEKFSIQIDSGKEIVTSNYKGQGPVSKVTTAPAQSGGEKLEDQYIEIKSPFVGTFYSSSSPDSDAFVKVGDKIAEGKVLCIVEAMKIMNEIEADISGEIVEICVANENFVEFGQVLFKLKS